MPLSCAWNDRSIITTGEGSSLLASLFLAMPASFYLFSARSLFALSFLSADPLCMSQMSVVSL